MKSENPDRSFKVGVCEEIFTFPIKTNINISNIEKINKHNKEQSILNHWKYSQNSYCP